MDSEHGELSPAVLRERDARFGDLLAAQRDRVRHRRARRASLGVLSLLALAALIAVLRPPERAAPRSPYEIVERLGAPAIEVVGAASGRADGFVAYLDDEEMLAELRAAGFDVGLARVGERVLFVSR